jgi:hypothetical protein
VTEFIQGVRRGLVKTGNSSVCATADWKFCKPAVALYLNVVERTCNRGAIKYNHPK